jgi:hypothetical protein
MDVVVVHDIRDPETFWGAVQDVIDVDRIPGTITVHACNPDPSGTRALCLQEASSVELVRHWIEETCLPASNNEYFPVVSDTAFALGLPGRGACVRTSAL